MALGDVLLLDTPLNEQEALQFFLTACLQLDIAIQFEESDGVKWAFAELEHYVMTSQKTKPSVGKMNRIDFHPVIRIDIQGHSRKKFVSERISIFKGVLLALKNTAWDITLVHSSDEVVLWRKAGNLVIKRGHHFWTQEMLDLITMPYTIEDIPNL